MNKFRQQSKFTPNSEEDKQFSKTLIIIPVPSYYTQKILNDNGKLFPSSSRIFSFHHKINVKKKTEDEGKNSS